MAFHFLSYDTYVTQPLLLAVLGRLAQLVEHQAANLSVACSSQAVAFSFARMDLGMTAGGRRHIGEEVLLSNVKLYTDLASGHLAEDLAFCKKSRRVRVSCDIYEFTKIVMMGRAQEGRSCIGIMEDLVGTKLSVWFQGNVETPRRRYSSLLRYMLSIVIVHLVWLDRHELA